MVWKNIKFSKKSPIYNILLDESWLFRNISLKTKNAADLISSN